MHSLHVSENVDSEYIRALEPRISLSQPGEEIYIDYIPDFVNITLIDNDIINNLRPEDYTLIKGEKVISMGLKDNYIKF